MGLSNIFRKSEFSTSNLAKDRLKLVLVSDRANCSPELMEQMKNDMLNVVSKYIEIDMDGIDIKISANNALDSKSTIPSLIANIPIKDMSYCHLI